MHYWLQTFIKIHARHHGITNCHILSFLLGFITPITFHEWCTSYFKFRIAEAHTLTISPHHCIVDWFSLIFNRFESVISLIVFVGWPWNIAESSSLLEKESMTNGPPHEDLQIHFYCTRRKQHSLRFISENVSLNLSVSISSVLPCWCVLYFHRIFYISSNRSLAINMTILDAIRYDFAYYMGLQLDFLHILSKRPVVFLQVPFKCRCRALIISVIVFIILFQYVVIS